MSRYLYVILALILTGCASSGSTFARPANLYNPSPERYPFHYATPYVDLFWHCQTPEAGGVSVHGYAAASTNRNMPVQNFSVILKAMGAKGQKVTERFTYGDNLDPGLFNPVPFEVSLAAAEGVARHDLYYSFYVVDGREKVSQFGTVENVCGGRWQRKAKPSGY